MTASDEIYGKVARVLVESLNVDEDDLTPTATLQGVLDVIDSEEATIVEFNVEVKASSLKSNPLSP